MDDIYLFVYGSLRKGLKNHYYLSSSEYIGDFISEKEFQMIVYEKLQFPYLIENFITDKPITKIKGEIYKINSTVLKTLDGLECHPWLYERKLFNFMNKKNENIQAWIYILIKSEIIEYIKSEIDKNYFLINSGDWTEFLYSDK